MEAKMIVFLYKYLKPQPKTAVQLSSFSCRFILPATCEQEGKHLEEHSLASTASSFLETQPILSIAAEPRGWK